MPVQRCSGNKSITKKETKTSFTFFGRQASFFVFMNSEFKPKISVFHCINSFNDAEAMPGIDSEAVDLKFINMACSSMVKDVFLLRAFEAGADAVIVLVCPEGQCRFIEGNTRAKLRVAWVQKLLDEIGLNGKRLALHNLSAKKTDGAGNAIQEMIGVLDDLGPNPAA